MKKLNICADYLSNPEGLFDFQEEYFVKLSKKMNKQKINEIISNHLKCYIGPDKIVSLSTFKDGQGYNKLENETLRSIANCNDPIEELKKLPCSLNLGSLQFIDNDIKEFVDNVYATYGLAPVVHMMITPENLTGFGYHIDPLKSYIMQLYGEKEWLFPIDEDEQYIFYPEPFSATKFQSFSKQESRIFKPGHCYGISRGTIHKAVNNSQDLNIHFAMPTYQLDQSFALKAMLEDTVQLNFNQLINLPSCDDESLLIKIKNEFIDNVKKINKNSFLTNLNEKSLLTINDIRKFGRPNKRKQLIKLNSNRGEF